MNQKKEQMNEKKEQVNGKKENSTFVKKAFAMKHRSYVGDGKVRLGVRVVRLQLSF
jgi:hypothetical protein